MKRVWLLPVVAVFAGCGAIATKAAPGRTTAPTVTSTTTAGTTVPPSTTAPSSGSAGPAVTVAQTEAAVSAAVPGGHFVSHAALPGTGATSTDVYYGPGALAVGPIGVLGYPTPAAAGLFSANLAIAGTMHVWIGFDRTTADAEVILLVQDNAPATIVAGVTHAAATLGLAVIPK